MIACIEDSTVMYVFKRSSNDHTYNFNVFKVMDAVPK